MRFLSIDQVAEQLQVGQSTIRGLLRSGELRGIQVGGRGIWRIGEKDLEDFISAAYTSTQAAIAAGALPASAPAEEGTD